jgi:hypothetical protein
MTVATTKLDRLAVGQLPDAWSRGDEPGRFLATGIRPGRTAVVTVRVFEPLEANPDYLLDRFGARTIGPLGRPRVQSLPESLSDGISVVAFEEGADRTLTARIDLVRRAWDLDIVVSARTAEVEAVEELFAAMLDLLATVRPVGDER